MTSRCKRNTTLTPIWNRGEPIIIPCAEPGLSKDCALEPLAKTPDSRTIKINVFLTAVPGLLIRIMRANTVKRLPNFQNNRQRYIFINQRSLSQISFVGDIPLKTVKNDMG